MIWSAPEMEGTHPMLNSRQLSLYTAAAVGTLLLVTACTPRSPNGRNANQSVPASGATQNIAAPIVQQQGDAAAAEEVAAPAQPAPSVSVSDAWRANCNSENLCTFMIVDISGLPGAGVYSLTPALTPSVTESTVSEDGVEGIRVDSSSVQVVLGESSEYDVGLMNAPVEPISMTSGAITVSLRATMDAVPHEEEVRAMLLSVAEQINAAKAIREGQPELPPTQLGDESGFNSFMVTLE